MVPENASLLKRKVVCGGKADGMEPRYLEDCGKRRFRPGDKPQPRAVAAAAKLEARMQAAGRPLRVRATNGSVGKERNEKALSATARLHAQVRVGLCTA